MESDDHLTLLPKLGTAIDAALQSWNSHTATAAQYPTYESIISGDIKDISTKVQALKHVLETLPSRHAALVQSYNDPELDFIELSDLCGNLLEELQSPEPDVELGEDFNKIFMSKRFIKSVVALEKEIRDEELWRSQELNRLKASQACLTKVREDGELDKRQVRALVDAMEEIGIPLIGFGLGDKVADEAMHQDSLSFRQL